jgi:hypothetical protein
MKNNFKNWLALSLLFSLGAPHLAEAQPAGKSNARPKITVRIYDYAEVKPRTLAGAKREATSVLRKAGVETAWLDCYRANGQENPACDRFLVATELVIRILRPAQATRAALRHDTCGIAVLPKNGGGGTYATVFYDGLEEVAKGQRLRQRLILGHTLAHEIGHLLLGTTRHSRQGIMRAVLSSNDWHLAGMGWLVFTPRQARQLRAEVSARVTEQETAAQSEAEPAD